MMQFSQDKVIVIRAWSTWDGKFEFKIIWWMSRIRCIMRKCQEPKVQTTAFVGSPQMGRVNPVSMKKTNLKLFEWVAWLMTKAVPLISQCFVALLLNSFNFKEFVSLGTVSSNHDFYPLWWCSILSASAYFSQVWWRINSLNMLTWKQQLELRMSSPSPSLPHSKISTKVSEFTL